MSFIRSPTSLLNGAFDTVPAERTRPGLQPQSGRRVKEREEERRGRDLLFVGCLTSQQHAGVYQGRICLDKFTCCHTEIDVPSHPVTVN